MSTKLINTLSKGLLKNFNKIIQDKEFYSFALNMSPTESITDRITKVTENKLEEVLSLNDSPYVILGLTWLGKEEYVYFIKNKASGVSEIWHYKNNTKTLKYANTALNFQFNKLISSTYRVDYKGDRLIYFVDGFNNDRVINIDKVLLTDNIVSLDLVSYYGVTNTVDLSVETGGKLLQGNYVVAVAFIDGNNSETNIKAISNSVNIGDGDYNEDRYEIYGSDNTAYFNSHATSFLEVKGLDNDQQTNKAIKVSIRDDVASDYEFMNVYVVRTTAETTEVRLLENIKISTSFIVTGSEKFITVTEDISNIVVSNILYNKSEVIFQKDNRLLRANTKTDSASYDFQSIANGITVKYSIDQTYVNQGTTRDVTNREKGSTKYINDFSTTTLLQSSSPDYLANNNSKLNKSFSRDEVYALGVFFELEGGVITDVYHIPGRLPNIAQSGNWENTAVPGHGGNTTDTDFDTAVLDGIPRWKRYNTAIKEDVSEGYLGYYRTEEVYPDGYNFPTDGEKDINNKSYIRHHKIPSDILEPLITTTVARGATTSGFVIQKNDIGLKFNITIPTELQNIIKKVNYTFTPKNNNNKNVLGKGIAYAVDGVRKRQSDQLNRFAKSDIFTDQYEFYSPEALFKFKQSNISARRVKPTAIYNGIVRYITKSLNINPPGATIFPHFPVWLNSEGANLAGVGEGQTVESYVYKQAVRFDNIFYNNRVPLIINDRETFELDVIKFIDKNGVVNSQGETISFEGNQNTVYFKIKNFANQVYFKLDMTAASYGFPDGNRTSHIMINYPLPWDLISYNWQESLNQEKYYDNVAFATLLSDNPNIDSDLTNLRYVTPYSKNDILTGDSFIDVLHGKRGYSSMISTQVQIFGRKSSTEFIVGMIDSGTYYPDYDRFTETCQYEDYFAFFTESQLNMRMRSGTIEETYYPEFTLNTNQLSNTYEKQAGKAEKYFIEEGYNQYNIEEKFANNVKLDDLYIDQRRLETRIVYSEVQNNESKVDNYRRTLANNYKDLITTRGGIYQMFMKQERLYALTRDSIFMINTSNQTLKTDSGYNVTVGTGDFFGIEPVELMSMDGGIGGTSSKLSLNESPYGYLYVDKYKNKAILFNENLLDINEIGLYENFKLELEQSLPELISELDCPQLGYGISTGYDPNLRRLLITKKDYKPLDSFMSNYKGLYNDTEVYTNDDYYVKDGLLVKHSGENVDFDNVDLFENKSFTVSFDPVNQNWISYHTYFPYRYIPHSNKVKPVIDNINEFGKDYSDIQILEIVFNDNPNITKVFDSIEVDLRSEDVNGNSTDDFFTEMIAYTEKQSTGLIELNNSNLTKKETYWNINNLRDDSIDYNIKKLFVSDWDNIKNDYYIDKVVNPNSMNINKVWYKKGRLRDKYLILRFIRKNLDNKKIFCNFVTSNIRQSIR